MSSAHVGLRFAEGGATRALTFVVDRAHEQYAGRLSVEEMARLVESGVGASGDNPDYVRNTYEHLLQLDIHDAALAEIVRRLNARPPLGRRRAPERLSALSSAAPGEMRVDIAIARTKAHMPFVRRRARAHPRGAARLGVSKSSASENEDRPARRAIARDADDAACAKSGDQLRLFGRKNRADIESPAEARQE